VTRSEAAARKLFKITGRTQSTAWLLPCRILETSVRFADTLRLSRLGVAGAGTTTPDTPGKMAITHRRDSFCGKMSACNNLRQYGIP